MSLLGLTLLVLLSLGGCELATSGASVRARGYTATEPHVAPGFHALRLPKGWARDTRIEYMEDNLAGRPQSPDPRTIVHMGGPDEAWLHFQLGQYSHIGGTVTPVSATLFARPPEAPRWTVADLDNGLGHDGARLRFLRREGTIEIYVHDDDAAQVQEFPWVVLNDGARGLRLSATAGKAIYTQAQLITLGLSILQSAEPDAAALSTARTAWRTARSALDAQARAALAQVQAAFGLTQPIGQGLTMLNAQSPAWQSGLTLNAFVRLGTIPMDGQTPKARAAALQTDMARLVALVDAHPGGTLAIYNPNDVMAAWVEDEAVRFFSLNDGVETMSLTAPHPLHDALRATLPAGALGLYREARLYLPEQDRVAAWFALTDAYRKAQSAEPRLVRDRGMSAAQ